MRVLTKEELGKIIQKNSDFVEGVAGGVRADLYDSDLSGADLRDANLRGANLHGADLSFANLRGANLHGANLTGADLHYTNLRGAILTGANLTSADLRGAILTGANLTSADLDLANLRGANLTGADLTGADLTGANLHGSCLIGANISGAFLDEKEQARKGTILKKKIKGYKRLADGSICVLSIPKGAIVFSINGSKCRTNKASVLEGGGASSHDREFVYKKGEKYEIVGFNLAYNLECASGIHFFRTRKEAEDYKS